MTILAYGSIQCAYECAHRSVASCTKRHNSQVIWKLTFDDAKFGKMVDETIIMQTKEYGDDHSWNNLTNCNQSTSLHKYSLQCEIDRKDKWFMYSLRILLLNNTRTEIICAPKNHYQSGLLCYPNHGIINLACSNVKLTSLNVSWSFYSWDIKLIRDTKIILRQDDRIISKLTDNNDNAQLNRTLDIQGLDRCTLYNITVRSVYISSLGEVQRSNSTRVKTKCHRNKVLPITAIIVIIFGLFLMVILIVMFGWAFIPKKVYNNQGRFSKHHRCS